MVASTTTDLMTAEEFCTWAELPGNADKRYELENGCVRRMSAPDELHVRAAAERILSGFAFQTGGIVTVGNRPLIVRRNPDTVSRPDISFSLTQVMIVGSDHPLELGLPDLVVEVESDADRYGPTTRAIRAYLRSGVPLVWLISPQDRIVTVYTASEFHVLDETEELTGNGVLPDFRCPVASFFNWPEPATRSEPDA